MNHHPILRLLLLLPGFAVAQDAPMLALQGHDPVALARGEELPGDLAVTATFGSFRYRFANQENLATFQQDPARWSIQWDGACGRMGPRSGRGAPERWAVHDGRIFVFASEACRTAFRKAPERFLPVDAAPPTTTPDSTRTARQHLDRAIAAFGGKDRLAAISTIAWFRATQQGDVRQEWQRRVDFARGMRLDQDYIQGKQEWRNAEVLRGDEAFALIGSRREPLGEAAARELRHELLREPVLLLRALDAPSVVLAAGAPTRLGDIELQTVTIGIDGTAITLGIDADGRIRTARTHGRGPSAAVGVIESMFDEFTADGLPRRVTGTFDGKPSDGLTCTWESIQVDAPLPPELFGAKPR